MRSDPMPPETIATLRLERDALAAHAITGVCELLGIEEPDQQCLDFLRKRISILRRDSANTRTIAAALYPDGDLEEAEG
jgi:hypothetical protein